MGFVGLLAIMTAHSVMETARDTLFLTSLPATHLPRAYLAIALLAEIGGWIDLSRLVGRGAIVGALIAVYLWAAVASLDALIAWGLRSPRLGRFALGQDAGQLREQRAGRIVRWIAAFVWLYAVLGSIGLRDTTLDALVALLAARRTGTTGTGSAASNPRKPGVW